MTFEPGSQLEKIGDGAFFGTKLHKFCAPPHLTSLGAYCFANCRELEQVELNAGLKEIGAICFWGTPLVKPKLPPAVVKSDAELGLDSKSVKELHIPEGIEYVYPGWLRETSVERVYMPDSVSKI